MLSPTAPIAAGPVAAVAAEGPQDEAGAAFAQVLDQAEAQQREAGPAPDIDKARRPEGRHMPAPVDALQWRAAVPADAAPADAATAGADAAGDARAPAEPDDDGATEPLPTQPTPQELVAWVTALPLPRPPATQPAAPAGDAVAEAPSSRAPRAPRQAEPLSASPSSGEAPAAAPGDDRPAAPPSRAGTHVSPEPAADPRPRAADTPSTLDAARPVSASHDGSVASAASTGATGPAPTPLAAMPIGSPTRSAEPGAPLQAELHAAVGSDEFAPALGARLSVLVRDGIEHAQLTLNPAELGPIEVRIDVDGQRAQVDFSAAHASTRQALQDAVPALASALRESGLTLTGGGVFEQPRDQRGDAPPRDARQAPAAPDRALDDALPAAVAPRPTRTRGVLDLYA